MRPTAGRCNNYPALFLHLKHIGTVQLLIRHGPHTQCEYQCSALSFSMNDNVIINSRTEYVVHMINLDGQWTFFVVVANLFFFQPYKPYISIF